MSEYGTVTFEIARKPDGAHMGHIQVLLNATGRRLARVSYTPTWVNKQFDFPADELESNEVFRSLLSENLALLKSLTCTLSDGITISVVRQEKSNLDRLNINLHAFNQKPPHDVAALGRFVAAAKKEFGELLTSDILAVLGDDQKRLLAARESTVGQLESTIANVTQQFTTDAAEQRRALLNEVEKERRKNEEKLESERAAGEEELERKRQALAEQEAALAERLKKVDDKEARHARRKIREDLKTELSIRATTFELTKGTQSLREPIAWATWSLMVLFAALFAFSSGMSIWNNDYSLPALAKQLVLAAALASTTAFYLRWQNRWFEQHAQEEFRLKRMALDVDRASWVVEMAMEWKEDKGTELPKELLDRLSTHLFENTEQTHEELNPADQLASALFGSAARVKIALPGGSEAELDRRSRKELGRGAAK